MRIRTLNKAITFEASRVPGKRLWSLDLWQPALSATAAYLSYSFKPELQLWHRRLGHLGEGSIQKFMNLAIGVKLLPERCICKACIFGRMREDPYNTSIKQGFYPLEL